MRGRCREVSTSYSICILYICQMRKQTIQHTVCRWMSALLQRQQLQIPVTHRKISVWFFWKPFASPHTLLKHIHTHTEMDDCFLQNYPAGGFMGATPYCNDFKSADVIFRFSILLCFFHFPSLCRRIYKYIQKYLAAEGSVGIVIIYKHTTNIALDSWGLAKMSSCCSKIHIHVLTIMLEHPLLLSLRRQVHFLALYSTLTSPSTSWPWPKPLN